MGVTQIGTSYMTQKWTRKVDVLDVSYSSDTLSDSKSTGSDCK